MIAATTAELLQSGCLEEMTDSGTALHSAATAVSSTSLPSQMRPGSSCSGANQSAVVSTSGVKQWCQAVSCSVNQWSQAVVSSIQLWCQSSQTLLLQMCAARTVRYVVK